MTPKLKCIDHIHVYVKAWGEAEEWYRSVLGFERIDTLMAWAVPGGPLTLGKPDSDIHLALFERDDHPNTSAIAFGATGEEFLAWKEHLESQGLELRIADHDLAWSLYFTDPYGNMHEITTYDIEHVKGRLALTCRRTHANTTKDVKMTDTKVTRREALRLGMGAATAAIAAGVSGTARAASGGLATPHQTEGPFFPKQDQPDKDVDLTWIDGHSTQADGKVIVVRGVILDDTGMPVNGALIDVWQANVHGRYDHEDDPNPAPLDPNFQSWAKMVTGVDGAYQFKTIVPGAYKVDDDWNRPPHIHFKIAKRGYHELTTQMYFAGNELNDNDQILQALSLEEQALLVVDFQPAADDPAVPVGQFDVLIRKV